MIFKIKDFTSYSFVYTVCVAFSIPPIIYLTTLSWSKGIDTLLHITHPDFFELPSFTICSDFSNFIDFQKLRNDKIMFKNLNKFTKQKNISESIWNDLDNDLILKFFASQINISDILLYTKDLNQILESISLFGVSNLPEEDNNLDSEQIGAKYCRKIVALKNSFLCMVITCEMNNQRLIMSDKETSKSLVQKQVMLRFKFIHNEIKDFNYILMAVHDEPLLIGYEDRLSEIKIDKKPQLYQFQIRTYNNILLPPPSKTNCKNYTVEDDQTRYQKQALSSCLFDKLAEKNMVFYPNSINISWLIDHNYSLLLNKRPQYNGIKYVDESIESKEASEIFDECSLQFKQPDCIEFIYLIYYLSPIDLDSIAFYEDGSFRFNKEFSNLIDDLIEFDLNETELILHDERKYLYSVFQLLESSYPLMTNKYIEEMELKASVYGTFTTFRVSQLIKRLILWVYSGFQM